MSVCGIITAGGRGKRMESSIFKQFLLIENKPILVYTLEKFNHCDLIDGIIVVAPEDRISYIAEEMVEKFQIHKVIKIVNGGGTRQESVFAALKVVDLNCQTVVIHDAVRPLIHSNLLRQVIAKGIDTGAAVLAIPVQESIKKVSHHQIKHTIDRESVWMVQTPQVFTRDLIWSAYEQAFLHNINATDDSELLEYLGYPVCVVKGSRLNIKITVAEDLEFAKYLIKVVK